MIDYAGEKTVYGEIISKEKVKNTIGKLKLDNLQKCDEKHKNTCKNVIVNVKYLIY